MRRIVLAGISAGWMALNIVAAHAERIREIVGIDDARLEVIAEGSGPPVILLPSRGRDSEDFDTLADAIAKAGFHVLRPQPRGAGQSRGPMKDLTLHDLAHDTAAVIRHAGGGPAVIVGHAFGSWVARMIAADDPDLVRGVVIVAAAAKAYPTGFAGARELSDAVRKAGDPARSDAERLNYLRTAFFAPGHDASVWLGGWHPDVDEMQSAAGRATRQSEWWPGGAAPMLDLQAALDPFKPRAMMNEMREEFGERVTIAVIPDASHALIPEQPAAVADAIVQWIGTLPRRP
jgi:pimeloyl-ACP methyl ester carboxylesterase